MRTLFAIFRHGEAEPIWAKVTDQEDAEQAAIVAAVNGGNCELLSGTDLTARLGAARPTIEIIHGRDPDFACDHTVFVNGERTTAYTLEDLDPGRGWERSAWEDFKASALSQGSPAFLDALAQEFEAFDNSKYIEDK